MATAQQDRNRRRKLRELVLKRDGYLCRCAACKSTGRVRVAHEADHIVPLHRGGKDHPDNMQAINRDCHLAKSLAERGYRAKQRIGLDGFPIEPATPGSELPKRGRGKG
jgi:5-methylcytosine-specific restriction endonuclease McrA